MGYHLRVSLVRIGATWDYRWWKYLLDYNQTPPPGHYNHNFNTGVFIIRPGEQDLDNDRTIKFHFKDQEEFLYLLNLIKTKRVINATPDGGEQGWLNAIYLREKFDIGYEHNLCSGTVQDLGLGALMHNATIFHFAGRNLNLVNCPTKKPWLTACNKWELYRQKLPWEKA